MASDKNGTTIAVNDAVTIAGTIASIETGLDGYSHITVTLPHGDHYALPDTVTVDACQAEKA